MSIFAWGSNRFGEIGGEEHLGPISPEPQLITCLEDADIIQVSGGNGHSLVLNANGEVFSFGRGVEGQLGLGGKITHQARPVQVKENGLGKCLVKKICAADGCSAAITTRGELFEWGFIHVSPGSGGSGGPSNALPGLAREERGMSRQLKELLRASTLQYLQGEGATDRLTQAQIDAEAGILVVRTRRAKVFEPLRCPFPHKVRDIAIGYGHSLIVTEIDGFVWAKGYNDRGQLGDGTRFNQIDFNPVRGELKGVPVSSIACGNAHNLVVVASTGELFAWGSNVLGQLGISTQYSDQLLPVRALLDEPVLEVQAGSYHSVALTVDRTLYFFGHAEYGQYGEDLSAAGDFRHLSRHFFTPQPVGDFNSEGVRLKQVRCGQQFTCALDENGSLWTWGFAAFGNLGHGRKFLENTPQRVEGLVGQNLVQVSAGHQHVLVLTTPTGHPFALKNAPALHETDDTFDCELFGRLSDVRNCPPHRLKDLQELGEMLNLKRLSSLCSLQRYQRKMKEGLFILGDVKEKEEVRTMSDVPSTTFPKDMMDLLSSGMFADAVLASADFVEKKKDFVPSGHTNFSWSSSVKHANGGGNYLGHTDFSKGEIYSAVPVHKYLLSRYDFFNVLLNGDFQEGDTTRSGGVVKLDSLPEISSLYVLLQWIYTGTIAGGLNGDNIADLLRSSQVFGLNDLSRVCEAYLLSKLDEDNAEDILLLAEINNLQKLARESKFMLSEQNKNKYEEEEE